MGHLYVTLPCDSSLSSFPNNTVAEFTTKLSERVRLDGEYEVALAELIYPHSFHNMRNDDKSLYLQFSRNDGNVVFEYLMESAYYGNESEFAQTLTEGVNTALEENADVKNANVKFTFNERRRKIMMEIQCDRNVSLYMSDALRSKLGFCKAGPYNRGWLWATDSFDLFAGHRLMYVYTDIVAHGLVGSTKSPLLRVCNVSGKYGEIVRVTFERPFYVPVARREFDTILIDIRDELGRAMPFEFGKSVVTLHFRRRNSWLATTS